MQDLRTSQQTDQTQDKLAALRLRQMKLKEDRIPGELEKERETSMRYTRDGHPEMTLEDADAARDALRQRFLDLRAGQAADDKEKERRDDPDVRVKNHLKVTRTNDEVLASREAESQLRQDRRQKDREQSRAQDAGSPGKQNTRRTRRCKRGWSKAEAREPRQLRRQRLLQKADSPLWLPKPRERENYAHSLPPSQPLATRRCGGSTSSGALSRPKTSYPGTHPAPQHRLLHQQPQARQSPLRKRSDRRPKRMFPAPPLRPLRPLLSCCWGKGVVRSGRRRKTFPSCALDTSAESCSSTSEATLKAGSNFS